MRQFLIPFSLVLLMVSCRKDQKALKADEITISENIAMNKTGPHGGRPIIVNLAGETRGGIPGDPDGTGTFTMTLNVGQGELSYVLNVANIEPSNAAHIHRAPLGSAGPLAVGLMAPTSGSSSGTIQLSRELIKELLQNPSAFYVNIHNAPYPAGAVGAQLSK